MSIIETHYGQPSYVLSNNLVDVQITVQGGHLTADFKKKSSDKIKISPFFVAPWWKERPLEGQDEILKVLRGDFFCLPFGENSVPYRGKKYPVHGETSNNNWYFVSRDENDTESSITIKTDLKLDKGSVVKKILLRKDEPVIYSTNTIMGLEGKMPIGHHPTIQLPEKEGIGIIDMSPVLAGFTTPRPAEEPAAGGYSRIRSGMEIEDMQKVPCIDGNNIDISRYPTSFGYEEIVVFINNHELDFAYTAVSVPSLGYLYFQLKNPRMLSETLFWMSNGGRHYAPWLGRVRGVVGLEEITGFYHYGIESSVKANFLSNKGYRTFVDFYKDKPMDIKLIMGVVPIDKDFTGVKDIVRKDKETITIIGKGNERMDLHCSIDFLLD